MLAYCISSYGLRTSEILWETVWADYSKLHALIMKRTAAQLLVLSVHTTYAIGFGREMHDALGIPVPHHL